MNMQSKQKNESGLVSIVVVSIIIIILALTVVGFAKIMNRELRQSLDRELAAQANYAAESGLNDARAYISKYLKDNRDPDGLSTAGCLDLSSITGKEQFVQDGGISGHFNGNTDKIVKYTCVLIDARPKQLIYDIKQGESVIFRVVPSAPIGNLYFSWSNKVYPPSGAGICVQQLPGANAATHPLPKESDFTSGCETGMLRATVYPINDFSQSDQNVSTSPLAVNSQTFFMYSNGNAAQGQVGPQAFANDGSFVNGECNPSNLIPGNIPGSMPFRQGKAQYCNSSVQNVTAAGFYYVRLTALYRDLSVSIQASQSGAAGTPVQLGGAEAVIDVTGSGNDVLKRLQGRVPLSPELSYPNYGIQSMDTACKRFRMPVGPGGPNDYLDAVIDDPASGDAYLVDPVGHTGQCQPS